MMFKEGDKIKVLVDRADSADVKAGDQFVVDSAGDGWVVVKGKPSWGFGSENVELVADKTATASTQKLSCTVWCDYPIGRHASGCQTQAVRPEPQGWAAPRGGGYQATPTGEEKPPPPTGRASAWVTKDSGRRQEFDTDPLAAERKATSFEAVVRALFTEAADLLLSKHQDYGPLNISLSPGGAMNGLRVRLYDKIARLNNLIDSGREPEHESIEDTWRDLIGYSAIGLLVTRGQWPTE